MSTILSVENADSVLTSLGSSGRVKYSCVALSKTYLVLGATTGSVYFFERSSLAFVRVLSSADTQIRDPISVIRVSHSEAHIAFAAKGTIHVYEIHADKDKQVLKITDHKESEVTALVWSMDGTTVFSGDDAGNVLGSIISKGKFFFSADTIFKCDSRVVQLDLFSDASSLMLLASSLTKSTIVNVTKQTNTVIGKKARDGKHGGCFHHAQGCLFLSRPQQRVWAATYEGKVTATMIFDTSFGETEEDEEDEEEEEEDEEEKKIPLLLSPSSDPLSDIEAPNFGKMLPYGKFLISWDEKSLVLFDVTQGHEDVLEWRHDPNQIHDIFAADDVVAVLHGANKTLSIVRHSELGNDITDTTTTNTDTTVTPPTELDFPNQESATESPNPEILVDSQLEQQRAEEKEREEEEKRDKEREEEERREKEREEEERRKEEERKEEERKKEEELRERLERERKEEEERLERERKEEEERLEREEQERAERERLEQERLEQERREKERLEQERLEREREEQERLEREREEQERIERERKEQERREQERLEIERMEKERLAKLEEERLEFERQEQERVEREKQERLEQERLEQERIEKEKQERLERERLEQEQLERELEQERLEQERLEQERLEKEKEERERLALIETEKQRLEREEQERKEREQKEKARLEKQRLKKERLELERQKREQERLEKERLEKEEKERQEQERLEKERIRKEQLEKERLEKERLEREKIEQERLERERLEKERQEKEKEELERLKKERQEKKRLEKERLEKERLEKERLEQERLEKERLEKERLENERKEKARQEKERRDKEKKEKLEKERLEKEKQEKERLEKEKREREEKERLEKEKQEKERLEKEKQEKERQEKAKADKEKADKEKADKEKADKEKAEKEKAEKQRIEQKKQAAAKAAQAQGDIFAEDDTKIGNGVAAKKSPTGAKKVAKTGASIFDEEEPDTTETPVAAQVSAPPPAEKKIVKKKKPRTATIEAPKAAKPAAGVKAAQPAADSAAADKPISETKEHKPPTKPKTRKTTTTTTTTTATTVQPTTPIPAPPEPVAPIPEVAPAQDAAPATQEPEPPALAELAPSVLVTPTTPPQSTTPPPSPAPVSASGSASSSNLQMPQSGNAQNASPGTAARGGNEGFSMSAFSKSAGAVFKDFDRFTKKTVQQVQQIGKDIQKTDKIIDKVLSPTLAPPSSTSPSLSSSSSSSSIPHSSSYGSLSSLASNPTSPPPSSSPSLPTSPPLSVNALSQSGEIPPSDSTPDHWSSVLKTATQNITQNSISQVGKVWDATVQHTTHGLAEVWDATAKTTTGLAEAWDATVHHSTPSATRVADPLTKLTFDALLAFRKDNGNKEVLIPFLKLWFEKFKPAEFPLSLLGSEGAKSLQTEYSQVTDLATTCFEFRIFDSSPAQFITEYFNFLDTDQIVATCMQHKLEECFDLIFTLEDKKSTQRDANLVALELFLRDKDGYNAQALLKNAKKPLTMGARILPLFFESCPKDAISYTVALYPKIRPWYVEWKVNPSHPRYYIDYLSQLLSAREDCRKNQNFVHSFFGHCLQAAAPKREILFSSSHNPVRGAHKREWGYAENLMEVIQNEYQIYSRNSAHLQLLCEKYGFFPGLLQLYLLHGQIRQAVDLVISTDDETGLFHVLSDSSDSEMWSFAMERMQQLRNDLIASHANAPNALPNVESEFTITKDGFLKFMIRRLGPLPAMQLLLKTTDFAKSGISHEAYKVFTTTGKIEIREKRPLVYEMLSTIDSYLWSRKPKAVCPQIRYIFELESNLQPPNLQTTSLQLGNQPSGLPSYLDQPVIPGTPVALKFDLENFPTFYEEATGHWGAETEFSNGTCPLCALPLLENPEGAGLGLGSGPTVLIFPKCGHAFHGFCNENDHACSVCVANNIPQWSSAAKSTHTSQYSI